MIRKDTYSYGQNDKLLRFLKEYRRLFTRVQSESINGQGTDNFSCGKNNTLLKCLKGIKDISKSSTERNYQGQ